MTPHPSIAGVLTLAGAMSAAGVVHAESPPGVEHLAAGQIPDLPGKGRLPRREGAANLSVGGGALIADGSVGGEAFVAARFVEAIGIGAGVSGSGDEGGVFIRMDGIGLAINHWAFLGFADYVVDQGWRFGGAMLVPVRRDSYLRLSALTNLDDGASFGVGMEHDLW